MFLTSSDYDESLETSITDNGNLFVDKDQFLQLFEEQGIKIKY